MNFCKKFIVKPGSRIDLDDIDPECTGGLTKEKAASKLQDNKERLNDLQYKLYAESKKAMLIVLQGIDAGGKDGTIRSVMTSVNPQGCRVISFKSPNPVELSHDYLWRIHHNIPPKGMIHIFNRSHYEDVLIVRVHGLSKEKIWKQRYEQINNFERYLSECDVHIVKFFLYISKDEQLARFKQRIEDPSRQWKISPADFQERKYWDDYKRAYEAALSRCSQSHAPWYVIPANKKWFRNLAISSILVEHMERMKMRLPKPSFDVSKIKVK